MIWQDIVIMFSCFGFSLALIPSIRGKNKPARLTCLMTALLLTTIAVCFGSLKLYLAMVSEITAVIAWSVLLFQRRS